MPRGERGGKKTRKSEALARETLEGRHNPKSAPTGSASLARVEKVRGELAASSASRAVVDTVDSSSVGDITQFLVAPALSENPQAGSSSDSKKKASPAKRQLELPRGERSPKAKAVAVEPVSPTVSLELVPTVEAKAAPVEPKATPVVAKAVSAVSPKAVIPKARPRISDPVVGLSPAAHIPVERTAAPSANCFIRISVDLHGVLDLNTEVEGRFERTARSSLCNWLHKSRYHQAGICSYIGRAGPSSQARRQSAVSEVHRFNSDYHTQLRLLIDSDKAKPLLNPRTVSIHIDDRLDLAWKLSERGLDTILVNPFLCRNPPRHLPPGCVVVEDLTKALAEVTRRGLVPKEFPAWPGIFTTA